MAAEVGRKRRRPVPLIGRGGLMKDVKATVKALVAAYCEGDDENSVRFITFEGGSGIGKTRCLQEIREQVRLCCTPADFQLKSLYDAGAVHQIFVTFNGRGSEHSHMPSPDIAMDGSKFLEVTILSELLHGLPFFKLDAETQGSISSFPSFAKAMGKVCEFLKQGKPGVVLLYLLLDEMQLLAAQLGTRVRVFLKEMCDGVGRFMRNTCKQEAGGLILIPCLAGCRVPEVGTFGACKWPKIAHRLTGLSLQDSREVVEQGAGSSNLMEHEQFGVLLQDCLGVPRFLEWVSAGLRNALGDIGLDDLQMIDEARRSMITSMECWAGDAIEFGGSNLEQLKDAFRYCLIQGSVDDSELAVEESIRGYFCWKEEAGKIVFEAPNVLLHHLGHRLRLHQPLVELRPDLVQSETLERACLEMLYVRLCLARGKTVKLDDLFPGCICASPFEVRVPERVSREDEVFQFLRPGQAARHFARKGDTSTRLVAAGSHCPPRTIFLPAHGIVMKTMGSCPIVDGRLFLRGRNVEVGVEAFGTLELWIQCKGQEKVTVPEMKKWCDEAFDEALKVFGREKVYIILVPYHSFEADLLDAFFEEQQLLGRQVLVLDGVGCEAFMPGFFHRCAKRS
ncbi:hypothetical protein SELMODRAFT_430380 [Selaginella moellendorffii]|uniref:Uncharacterized protein n=1 Tax=Selaginella moellendorffii TaxID=88036 RepID=D8T985_SELML|nr:hypothetical protein SELMODRAFT_430380 [Selaginella moellendorffii]